MTNAIQQPSARLKSAIALIALMGAAAMLAACSTTEGFGKDIKHLGSDIEESAAENK